MSKNVGVIGLGAMGLGVARSLLRAGFRAHACDVRREVLAGDYTPLSAVNIFVKDLGIVLDTAKKAAFPLPLTSAAHQMFLAAAAAGRGGEDDAAVVKNFPGIELPRKKD